MPSCQRSGPRPRPDSGCLLFGSTVPAQLGSHRPLPLLSPPLAPRAGPLIAQHPEMPIAQVPLDAYTPHPRHVPGGWSPKTHSPACGPSRPMLKWVPQAPHAWSLQPCPRTLPPPNSYSLPTLRNSPHSGTVTPAPRTLVSLRTFLTLPSSASHQRPAPLRGAASV